MSAPVRFLFVALAGWAVLRGITGGAFPVADVFTLAEAEAAPPPIVPTQFPAIAPVEPQTAMPGEYAGYPAYPPPSVSYSGYQPPRNLPAPIYNYYYPAAVGPRSSAAVQRPAYSAPLDEEPQFYAPIPQLEQWDLAEIAHGSFPGPPRQSTPVPAGRPSFIPQKHLDRLQLSAWALWRGQGAGSGSLASGGTLGGSQAGARLTYAIDRRIAASVRSSAPLGGSRGGEAAAGVRLTPFPSIPVSITAERRQAIGKFSTGRSAFALFAEGGVYQRPLGWSLLLDGYAQGGVVGVRSRDLFVDGGVAVSRPVWGRFSAGLGAWGGYQPGLYRVDAGPRLSMRIRNNVSIHFDWRQRLAGDAEPGSGPAVALAANF